MLVELHKKDEEVGVPPVVVKFNMTSGWPVTQTSAESASLVYTSPLLTISSAKSCSSQSETV